MKNAEKGFKTVVVTLTALVITTVIHRLTYSAFVMAKTGRIYWYDFGLWKEYWSWLPGKILCIVLAVLIIALIIESVYFIFFWRREK